MRIICLGMISELLTVLLAKEERTVLYLIESKSTTVFYLPSCRAAEEVTRDAPRGGLRIMLLYFMYLTLG